MQFLAFRRFENLWDFSKSPVAHNKAECVQTDLALSDVLVSIHPRTAHGFGIVHVNGGETVESDYAIEFAKCFLDPGFTPDVVTGGENVRGVETNTKSLRLAHILDDVSDLLESVAQTRALAGGRFDRDARLQFWDFSKHAIDRVDNFFEAGFFTNAEMRAGMKNQKRQLELMRAGELFRQGADGIGVKLRICGREIDQIIRVGKDRQQVAALDTIAKRPDFLACERAREPLHIVLHEHLNGGALDRTAALDCGVHAATARHVRAEKNFRPPILVYRFVPAVRARHNFDK